MNNSPVYIDDIIGEIVQATSDAKQTTGKTLLETIIANETAALGRSLIQQIRYSQSSFDELIENLAQADKSGEGRFKKYPIVHLVHDLYVDRGTDIGVYGSTSVNIIFIHQTVQAYKNEQRDEKVFKPVLYPIYYEFLNQLNKSPWIFATWETTGQFKHRMVKRAFWGNRNLQGSKNVLNDYVDALDIQNLQLKINYSNC